MKIESFDAEGKLIKLSEKEKQAYTKYVKEKNPKKIIKYIKVTLDGDFANLEYEVEEEPFDRIRRITGYLSEVRQFNDGKKDELKDRVLHK